MNLLLWMGWITLGFLLLVGLGFFIALWGRNRYGYPTKPDQIEFIHLLDGWSLSAERHFPKQAERRGVVITCHGVVGNHVVMDVDEGFSIVQSLQRAGYEVWNVNLRGAGHSRYDGKLTDADWSFDDYVRKDIPAFLDTITDATGEAKIHWVGHSMGGMIMHAYLGCHPEDTRVASFCSVASPGELPRDWIMTALAGLGLIVTRLVPYVPTHWVGRVAGPFLFRIPMDMGGNYPPNLTIPILRRGPIKALEPFSRSLARQFSRMIWQGRFNSNDGKDDYKANASRIKTPGCFVVGTFDTLATEARVRRFFEAIESPYKEFYLAGRCNGARMDYCHSGLLCGIHAEEEVHPLIVRWLDDQIEGRTKPRAPDDLPWNHSNRDPEPTTP